MRTSRRAKLEKIIGYEFRDRSLLDTALTHKSYCYPNKIGSNERLEFLGDSVLQLCVGEYLYLKYPDKDEGLLTRIRSNTVQRDTLAHCARLLKLGSLIKLGPSERNTGGSDKDSILEDAFEALIGALYLDGGLDVARSFVIKCLEDVMCDKRSGFQDSKTRLQELAQAQGAQIEYECMTIEGPPHNRRFTVCVKKDDMVLGTGKGRTKKEAELRAARVALARNDERGNVGVSKKD
ncbi:MAG TPA: ribonuclease III [Clostridia bacterium]|nr:ribonuclease III [Clostridia bacterium]